MSLTDYYTEITVKMTVPGIHLVKNLEIQSSELVP